MSQGRGNQGQGIGASPPRKEDRRFLTGEGRFTDDISPAGCAYAAVVRSPHAHALIRNIDVTEAEAAPGVRLVLTAAEIRDLIPNPIPSLTRTPPFDVRCRDGGLPPEASQYPLARDRVRYVGEPVAFVVAESLAEARDAAELVEVDFEPLAAVIETAQALDPAAPAIWDETPGNVSFEWEGGDSDAVEAALAEAAHVTRRALVNNRVAIAFMEPRAAIGEHDPDGDRFTLATGCQSAHGMQSILAGMLGIETARLRVVVPDTGGGFGARGGAYPEFALVLVAARRLGRPVKWTAERGESFLTDTQARDHVMHGALALDAEGRITALKVAVDWRHGAYLTSRSVWVMISFLPPTLGGVYRIPAAHIEMRGIFSNTAPLAAYRGIGRIEATYLIESLIDAAAAETGRDPIELRRANLVAPAEMPWRAPGGAVYHSGEFEANMDRALELSDWPGFEARRREAEAKGRLRGIGLAMYIENDGGTPSEFAEIRAGADGTVTALVGTQDFGMGHETMYSQVLSDELGVGFEQIRVVFGDTDRIKRGAGSAGSRSARIGGGAAVLAAREMVEKGRALAAEMMEAALSDIEYGAGAYGIVGTDRSLTLFEVAAQADEEGRPLAADTVFDTEREAHSNGCHVAEVEIDPELGRISLEAHIVVADVGRVMNPRIVEGQMHGGAAQGIGQALLEDVVHDASNGQALSGSFMDYAMPRADDLPAMVVAFNEILESDNPLGIKGAGECATTGAPAAVMNAVRDALRRAGAGHLDMPATPEAVWRALSDRQAR